MAVFSEGTTAFPTDSQGRYGHGLLGDDGLFKHWRRDNNNSAHVALWGTNNQPLLTTANPGQVQAIGANQLVLDTDVTYNASTGAGTVKTVDINLPAAGHHSALCYLAITNPSTASAMNLTFQNQEIFNFDGSPDAKFVDVSTGSIAANKPSGVVLIVQGWLMGDALCRLSISNVSTTEGSAVVLHIKVRRV